MHMLKEREKLLDATLRKIAVRHIA